MPRQAGHHTKYALNNDAPGMICYKMHSPSHPSHTLCLNNVHICSYSKLVIRKMINYNISININSSLLPVDEHTDFTKALHCTFRGSDSIPRDNGNSLEAGCSPHVQYPLPPIFLVAIQLGVRNILIFHKYPHLLQVQTSNIFFGPSGTFDFDIQVAFSMHIAALLIRCSQQFSSPLSPRSYLGFPGFCIAEAAVTHAGFSQPHGVKLDRTPNF